MLRGYHLPVFLLAIVASCPSANAGEILLETRATTTIVSPWDALASWHAQSSAVTSTALAEFTDIGLTGSHHHSRLTLIFDTADYTPLEFEFGLDAGFGAALYVNGDQQSATNNNLWWDNNWNATDQLLRLASTVFMRGRHTIELYWAEDCCAGAQSGRFRAGSSEWQALTTANLQQVTVAEPGTLALLCAGIVSLSAGVRRRRKTG